MPARRPPALLSEIGPTLALATPIAVGSLGVMLMGLVDTSMVGGLGPRAVAAVGLGTSLYGATYVMGLGLLLGLDRVASVALGAGRPEECRQALVQGGYLGLGMGLLLTCVLQLLADHLAAMGVAPDLVPDASRYLRVLSWSLLPALLFGALRQTLQAMGHAHAATVVLLSANLVNAIGNRMFIHGLGPIPRLGVAGSAWATLASRVFMCLALGAYAWRRGIIGPRSGAGARWHGPAIRELIRLGLPASVQMLLEVGVFATATILIAGLGDVPAAAHQVVLVVSSFTFMVPLGIGGAGAVRVGNALGREDRAAAARAGWAAIVLGVGFMGFSALVLLFAATPILHLFVHDEATVALGRQLLFCAAVFQLFDGAQVTLSGALRGFGETLEPMLANLAGHWMVGLPIGLWCCYQLHLGALGIWIGLSAGLAAVAVGLGVVWVRRVERSVGGHTAGVVTS